MKQKIVEEHLWQLCEVPGSHRCNVEDWLLNNETTFTFIKVFLIGYLRVLCPSEATHCPIRAFQAL